MPEKTMEERLGKYLLDRSLNARQISRRMARQIGPVIPLYEVEQICALIISGDLDAFFEAYDRIVHSDKKTTTAKKTAMTGGRFGWMNIPETPSGVYQPDRDDTLFPPPGYRGFPGYPKRPDPPPRPDIPASEPTKVG